MSLEDVAVDERRVTRVRSLRHAVGVLDLGQVGDLHGRDLEPELLQLLRPDRAAAAADLLVDRGRFRVRRGGRLGLDNRESDRQHGGHYGRDISHDEDLDGKVSCRDRGSKPVQHPGAVARRMRSILDVSRGGCYIVSHYQNQCFEERRHCYENADRARFRVDYADPFGRLPAAGSASGDDDGPSGRGNHHSRRRCHGRGGSERTTPAPDRPRLAGPPRRHRRRARKRGRSPATWTSTSTSPRTRTRTLDFHRFVLLFNHSFSRPHPLRRRARARARVRRRPRGSRASSSSNRPTSISCSRRRSTSAPACCWCRSASSTSATSRRSFHGVERPFVDTVIIPTTWFDAGAGVHGELRPRLAVPRLRDGAARRAEIHRRRRASRRRARRARSRTSATSRCTGRLEYVGVRGLDARRQLLARRDRLQRSAAIDVAVGVVEFDGRYHRDRLELRGQFAQVFIDDAGALERRCCSALTGVNPEHRAAAARLLRRSARIGRCRGLAARRRRVRALRELRHAVPDAGRRAAAEAVRSRRLGRRRVDLLPDPGHRDQGRLLVIRNQSTLFGSARQS